MIFCIISCKNIMGQNISGYLFDQDDNPVEYANIIALQKSDSTWINGTTSDNNGYFTLAISNPKDCIIKISSICYKTLYLDDMPTSSKIYKLESDTQVLNEVVIEGRQNIIKKGKGKIIALIENTDLSHSGNATDVLTRLPLLIENNGEYHIMGKGIPQIFINGRLIEDNSELLRLKSNEIKSVEIITTPGVEYSSSTSSVIRIHTIPLKGEGISGNFQTYVALSERTSEYLNANLKYRNKGFDLFLDGDMLDYRGDYLRRTEYVSQKSSQYHGNVQIDRLKGHYGGGLNYIPNESQSFGFRYNFTNSPKDNDHKESIVNEDNYYQYNSIAKSESDSYKNYFNLYYNGKMSFINIEFNADYSSGKVTGNNSVKELKEDQQFVSSDYGDNYDLFASKILLKYLSKKNTFLLGGECSFTDRRSNQNILSDGGSNDLFSSSNKNKQNFVAAFANYDFNLNEYYGSIGLRYEYTDFDYLENNSKIGEQSKKYGEIMPNITFGYEGEKWQGELSLRKYIERPTYDNLSNKISYVSYCARWSGNPYLLPSLNTELGIQFSWNNLTMIATMEHIKKQIFEVNQKHQDKPDVILVIPENLPSYKSYAIDLSYNTEIGFWQPSLDVCFQYQNLRYGNPIASYNKPIAEILQRNSFKFKNNFDALLTVGYRTKGNFATAYTKGYTNLGLTISKSFLQKALLLKFTCKDILNKYRESISVNTNGLSMIDSSTGNTRIFQLSISYYFNKSSNRYKGEGAGINEMNRL